MSTLQEMRKASKTLSSQVNRLHHAQVILDKSPDSEAAEKWMERCRADFLDALATHTAVYGAWLDKTYAADADRVKAGLDPVIPPTLNWV